MGKMSKKFKEMADDGKTVKELTEEIERAFVFPLSLPLIVISSCIVTVSVAMCQRY